MMIDEAIEHARDVAKRNRILLDSDELVQKSYDAYFDKLKCEKCAEEHEQLAKWLEELKAYKHIGTIEELTNSVLMIEKSYNKGKTAGAREFAEWLSNTEYVTSQGHFILPLRGYFTVDDVVSEWEKEQK